MQCEYQVQSKQRYKNIAGICNKERMFLEMMPLLKELLHLLLVMKTAKSIPHF